MNKLDKAHDYAMQLVASPDFNDNITLEDFVTHVWRYADLMQEEYDNRNNTRLESNKKILEDVKNDLKGCEYIVLENVETSGDLVSFCKSEDAKVTVWQPDCTQAPEWANYWCMYSNNGTCYWTESQPIKQWDQFSIIKNQEAPTFNYQGDWKKSLRERPKCNKLRSGYVQQIPRPFFANEDEIGSLDKLKEDLKSSLNSNLKDGSKEGVKKVVVESKQSSCNCPHWKGSSFFMGDTFTCSDCGGSVTI